MALCDLAFRHNLTQFVDFPTHSQGNILDLVLSGSVDLVHNLSRVSSQLLCSDHFILSFEVPVARAKNTSKVCMPLSYNFKRTDFDGLSSFLLDIDYRPLFLSSDVEFVWLFLKDVILRSISLFTPQVKVRSRLFPVWFHSGVRHQLNRIHSLRKQCKRNPSSHNSHHLSLAEHQLQCDILDARANYEGRLVTEFSFSNDSRVYHYIKSFSGQNKLLDVMYWVLTQRLLLLGKLTFLMSSFTLSSTQQY